MAVVSLQASDGILFDHGGLTGLVDDDHTQYLLLAGRAGGQTAIGGTAVSEELALRGTSNANLGLIRAQSPIVFDDTAAANALSPYFVDVPLATAQTFPGVFIGGGFNASPTINFANSIFIWEGNRISPNITSGVNPSFAAFTLLQALPVLRSVTAGFNPLNSLTLNIGVTMENAGVVIPLTAATNFGISFSPQTRVTGAFSTMSVTSQTAVSCRPTFSTIANSTANLGTIRGLHCQNPAVALFQPSAGTETLTAYYGLEMDNIAFGGNVPKAAVRSSLNTASSAFFLWNVGTANSTFNNTHLFNVGIVQHLGDGISFNNSYGAAGGDMTTYWDGTGFVFDPLVGDILRLRQSSGETIFEIDTGAPTGVISFNFAQFAFGQAGALGNQVGVFVAPTRTTSINGSWSDFLLTQSGNLTIDDTMSDVSAWVINPISLTTGTGSITGFVAGLQVGQTNNSLGGADTMALRVNGRHHQRGVAEFPNLTPTTLTANVNDYAPATGSAMRQVWRLASDDLGVRTITGIAVQQAEDTQWVTNVGTVDNLILSHQDVLSTATNRIISPTGANLTLGLDESALLWHDTVTDRWRILYHTGA